MLSPSAEFESNRIFFLHAKTCESAEGVDGSKKVQGVELRVLPSNELGQLDVGVAGKDLDAVGGHCCTECVE